MEIRQDIRLDTYNNNVIEAYASLLFNQSILYQKLDAHEKRITNIESGLEDLRKLIPFDNRITNDDQFSAFRQNTRFDVSAGYEAENRYAEGRLEDIVSEFRQAEEIRLQVQIAGKLVDEIRDVLKDVPKQKNNYRRQLLLMFHEIIKQNYTKVLFNEPQIEAMLEIAKLCNKEFVTREQYFEMDDILCERDLDMMPNWE